MKITNKRWQQAQEAERRFHNDPKEVAIEKYKDSYRQYFEHLGMDFDLKGKSIIEIGPADIPALYFCDNIGLGSYIVEPMPSSVLHELANEKRLYVYKHKMEDLDTDINEPEKEIWFFNVLQHVIDPDECIRIAKKWTGTIRFFEPVDQPISDCHPHGPTQADFKRWFGDAVQYYPHNPNAKNFHTEHCCFGTWTK